jgi:predicted MPP superfamily phosphohydrolase
LYLLVSVIVHALAARWSLLSFPALARRRRAVIACAVVLALLPTVARTATWNARNTVTATLFAATTLEAIAVGLAAICAAIIGVVARLIGLASRRAAAIPTATATATTTATPAATPTVAPTPIDGPIGRRAAIERIAGVTAFGAAGLALGWGAVRGRHAFVLEEVVVRVKDWPRVLDGYTIVQVSDVHVGAFVGERELDEGLDLARRAKADMLVATGDLVDFRADSVDLLASRLAAIGARDGVYAITGNHDHYAGAAEVVRRLRAARIDVLSNDGRHVRAGDGGGFALLGVDDLQGRARPTPGFDGPDLDRAIGSVRSGLPRVLLAHQPVFLYESAGRVDLQLSGHTHGGQINPGFTPASLVMRWVAGRYDENGTTLYVNRGFGTVGPPARLGAPPEVTKFVITSA